MMAKISRLCHSGTPHIDDWINDILTEKYKVCKEIKQLAELVLAAIDDPEIYVDSKRADGVIEFINKYRPYELAPPQRFIHAAMNAIRYKKDDSLVFTELFLLCARGFGKNSVASDEALYKTSNRNGISEYNVDIVANNEKQAKTSFKDVYNTIKDSTILKKAYKFSQTLITFKKTKSELTYHTSNARTKDGLRPGLVIFDEIHEYENYKNINVFINALGKVADATVMYLTTDGYVRGAVLDDYKDIAKDILSTCDYKSGMLPILAKIDSFEEWEDPTCWVKANPMLPYLPTLQKEYQKAFKRAKRSKELFIDFLTKRLNFPIEDTTHGVAEWDDIVAASKPLPDDLIGMECVGAIDYADVRDFIGVGLLFKRGKMRYWLHHTFIVSEALKIQDFKMDFQIPVNEGIVTIVPGKVMDPKYVAEWFVKMAEKYKIKNIAMDDFRKSVVKEVFQSYGLPIQVIRSGSYTDSKLAPVIDMMFANHEIVFGEDRMMRWYTNNVYVDIDGKGNKTYKKIDPEKRKTDGFMAMVHAMAIEEQLTTPTIKINRRLRSYTT
ncbi:TPA: terminase large subunit [Streptococcus equi subsp. equi]|uniref:terminase TerL endonuclease subunit n=1 Tax=Streptococcus equi TaxID=1336 RepID=UPI001BDEB6FB|nr:terminase TerL endonuclease subunit [Streptococcus equi]MBT1199229.1 terminase large subunit [Streptococcus equi subsp. equi]MBT1201066.1 terminase large subunit [Streptococcus equi subsp. equi]MBT1211474.1 terminase large subunit [Streptococcus equi subsp. equi]MCD3433642.1 terminase large subunit [Streptococcus equi subsp. zooepidemicus]MCD3506679.1 terminase large subunit [Streptococcus equi subsp. equi]